MSRGNVFKLSGNMALGGGGSDYQNVDIDEIKNSLKLLKAKKNRQNGTADSQPSYGGSYGGYGNSYGNSNQKSYTPTRNEYDYDALTKNHMPSSQKQFGSDFSKKGYGGSNDYNKYPSSSKNTFKDEKPYQYNSKPPAYQQNNNTKNTRNSRPEPQKYDAYEDPPSYPSRSNVGKNTASTRGSNANRPQYSNKTYDKYDNYDNYPPAQNSNTRQERSIKEVNRQNQVDIVQYDPSELKPCRMGCGRKFNPDSIKKHEANCKKVFQNKRKEFDAQKHRLVDNQQKKLMRKGEQVEKKIENQKKTEKIPKWKAQSMAFRAGLKRNRNEDVDPREAAMMKEAEEHSMVKCHICGRTFNETAGPRHIQFCESKAKKDGFKKKR